METKWTVDSGQQESLQRNIDYHPIVALLNVQYSNVTRKANLADSMGYLNLIIQFNWIIKKVVFWIEDYFISNITDISFLSAWAVPWETDNIYLILDTYFDQDAGLPSEFFKAIQFPSTFIVYSRDSCEHSTSQKEGRTKAFYLLLFFIIIIMPAPLSTKPSPPFVLFSSTL